MNVVFLGLYYPDQFQDMDPQAIHREYLTEFQGLNYDLDEHGIIRVSIVGVEVKLIKSHLRRKRGFYISTLYNQ